MPFEPRDLPPATVNAAAPRATKALRSALAWAPVVIALLVLGQVAWLGLRPAFAERVRLDQAEQQMRARVEREEREAEALERLERAQNDPIYLERERRALRSESTQAASDDGAQR